jgi:FlaA1/EpsC-like NDP-sugar epimerase
VWRVAGQTAIGGHRWADRVVARLAAQDSTAWTNGYLRHAIAGDGLCALAAGLLAFQLRLEPEGHYPSRYLVLTAALPVLWMLTVWLAGGYDSRFIGVGSDEFRRVLNAGMCLTAAVAIASYATKTDVARGYVVSALLTVTLLSLLSRFILRKRLHKVRRLGSCMRKVVIVGHENVVAELATMLHRETYHGLSVVAACAAGRDWQERDRWCPGGRRPGKRA